MSFDYERSEHGSDQRLGWPLHDGLGVVSAATLEEQLELIRARTVSPLAGVFGPASMTWRMNREAILFLAAGRVDPADRARLYSESRLFAAMFGIPRHLLPADHSDLTLYVRAMCDSDVLTVSAAARHVATQIFAPSRIWRVPRTYMGLTAGMLPERLRREFGLSYGPSERRRSERALAWVRRIYPSLPARVRYVGPYHEAQQRLAGSPTPDISTRLANRLWIGQASLAD